MGASQSSQPPSRHNSRHGTDNTNKHKQKAGSVSSTPMKQQQQQPTLPVIIDIPNPAPSRVPTTPPVPQSFPAPAVAVPIPVKKKPASLPTSKDNSYVDQHKDADLLHRFGEVDTKDDIEEMDETEVQSKFRFEWPFEDFIKTTGRMTFC